MDSLRGAHLWVQATGDPVTLGGPVVVPRVPVDRDQMAETLSHAVGDPSAIREVTDFVQDEPARRALRAYYNRHRPQRTLLVRRFRDFLDGDGEAANHVKVTTAHLPDRGLTVLRLTLPKGLAPMEGAVQGTPDVPDELTIVVASLLTQFLTPPVLSRLLQKIPLFAAYWGGVSGGIVLSAHRMVVGDEDDHGRNDFETVKGLLASGSVCLSPARGNLVPFSRTRFSDLVARRRDGDRFLRRLGDAERPIARHLVDKLPMIGPTAESRQKDADDLVRQPILS